MTFTYQGADLSTTIAKYTLTEGIYRVSYLDGNINEYYCADPKETKRIEGIMLEQAFERQNNFDIEGEGFLRNLSLATAGISLISSACLNNVGLNLVSSVGFPIGFIMTIKQTKIINELNKYKMFLEMYKDLPYINESELLGSVEFDKIYQIPLSINTVDKYSYGDMKVMYKKFNSMVCE